MRFAIHTLLFIGIANLALAAPTYTPTKADLTLVRTVYQSITEAVGDYRRNLPEIHLRDGSNNIAAYRSADNKIFVEQKALDICKSLGEDAEAALAFLISHELSHFYQQHDWSEAGFGTNFVADKATFNRHKLDEQEADTYGAFITHLAGYNTIKIIPTLLEKLYAAYNLQSKDLSAYPSLAERKTVAEEACAKSQELITVFDLGNYLLAVGAYNLAANNYAYVLQYIKSKELYNNLGIANLYAALVIPDRTTTAYFYPVEVDLDIPLRDGSPAVRQALLQRSVTNLQTAVGYDSRYYTGFLNLACAKDLSGQPKQALELLDQLQKFTNNPTQQARIAVIRGIATARLGDKTLAARYFDEAQRHDNSTAVQTWVTRNKAILTGDATATLVSQSLVRPTLDDKMDGISLLYDRPKSGESVVLKNEGLDRQELFITSLKRSKLYTLKASDAVFQLQLTNSSAERTQKQIGVGSTVAAIKAAYSGLNSHALSHRRGYFLIFPQKGLIFNVNRNEQVTEWALYMKE